MNMITYFHIDRFLVLSQGVGHMARVVTPVMHVSTEQRFLLARGNKRSKKVVEDWSVIKPRDTEERRRPAEALKHASSF